MPEQYAPETDQQVRDLVAWAAADKMTLAVRGTGTKSGFGHEITTDCRLSLQRHTGITDYEPAELVMTARAGTGLDEVEAELARNGQALAFEPPRLGKLYGNHRGGGTVGGVFMGNLSGPRRYVSGAARDHLLGVHAVNGRGEVYKSGGTVIKNVTGYDLGKLLAGSWGTLSVITDISFKVLPLPASSMTLAITGLGDREGLELINRFAQSACGISGLACMPAETRPAFRRETGLEDNLVLARFEGTGTSIQERIDAAAALLPASASTARLEQETSVRVWQSIRDADVFADARETPALMKLSVPPASALDIARVIEQLGGCKWFADAAAGWIWTGICQASSADKINTLRREIKACSGSAVLYRAPESVKQMTGIYSEQPEAVAALTRRIKQSFDPQNILNPGRLGTV